MGQPLIPSLELLFATRCRAPTEGICFIYILDPINIHTNEHEHTCTHSSPHNLYWSLMFFHPPCLFKESFWPLCHLLNWHKRQTGIHPIKSKAYKIITSSNVILPYSSEIIIWPQHKAIHISTLFDGICFLEFASSEFFFLLLVYLQYPKIQC